MYELGTLVLYDKGGVYKIEGVGTPPIRGTVGNYYKLCAVFSNSNEIIYTPVDGSSIMRPLISPGEAANYLALFARLEPQIVPSPRTADLAAHYRDLLNSHSVEDRLLLIKEIQVRQRELARQKNGRASWTPNT